MYVVTRGADEGVRAGLISVAGLHTATLLHIGAAAAGLPALLLRSAGPFHRREVRRRRIPRRPRNRDLRRRDHLPLPASPRTARRLFAQGFVVNALNPKTTLFFFAFLPQFVDVRRGHVALQITVLGGVLLCLRAVTDSAYAVLAGRLGGRLRASPKLRRRQRQATSGVLIGLGALAGASGAPAAQP